MEHEWAEWVSCVEIRCKKRIYLFIQTYLYSLNTLLAIGYFAYVLWQAFA